MEEQPYVPRYEPEENQINEESFREMENYGQPHLVQPNFVFVSTPEGLM